MCCFSLVGGSVSVAIEDTLIPQDSNWRYLDDGSDAGSSWVPQSFDDSAWNAGPALLGYAGRQGQTTLISFGPDPENKFATTYFRHSFALPDPSIYTNLTLKLIRDDSAIVYLNGTEIHRANLLAGPIGFQDTAEFPVLATEEEFEFFYADIDPQLLVAGTNTIAVEIHRHSTSADLAFNLELIAGDDQRVPLVIRGPYLQRLAPTEVAVRWRTDISSTSAVRYGDAVGNLIDSVFNSAPTRDHEVYLTGIAPDSRVFYSVGTETVTLAGNDIDFFVDTPPPTGTPKPLRIWVTGDSGTANFRSEAVRDSFLSEIAATNTDLWLLLGDNAYTDGTDDQFQVAFFNLYADILRNTPTWTALGNHETHTASPINQTGPYFENFTLPTMGESGGIPSGTEAYYSFDYANIHFVCLDSAGSDRSVTGPMLTWLQADLADTQQEWTIAFWHHPPYSHGSHDSDIDSQLIDMRTNAVPILEAAGVDLVMAGHSHNYERSMLIDGHYGFSSELIPSMILDGGDGDPLGSGAYIKTVSVGAGRSGAVYMVAGSSGSTQLGALDHPIMIKSLLELGSVVIEVDGAEMNVRFLNDTNITLDQFTISKTGPPSSVPSIGSLGLCLIVALAVGLAYFKLRPIQMTPDFEP